MTTGRRGHRPGPALTVGLLMLAACGGRNESAGAEPPEGATDEADQAPRPIRLTEAPPPRPTTAPGHDPCGALDEPAVRRIFQIPEATDVQRRPGRTTCLFVWEKPNAEALRAEIAAKQRERIAAIMAAARERKGGEGGSSAQQILEAIQGLPSVESRVTLTRVPRAFDDAAAAKAAYEGMIANLERGMSQELEAEAGGGTVTFQGSYAPVSDVPADDARWSEKLRQLSLLADRRILHLTVEAAETPAGDLALAKEVARLLLGAGGATTP